MSKMKVIQFPKQRRPAPDPQLDRMIAEHRSRHTGRLAMFGVKPGDMAARLLNRTNHRATRAF